MGSATFLATHASYRQHLRPVYEAMDQARWLESTKDPGTASVWVTASARDFAETRKLKGAHVVMEHGVGLQWYSAPHLARFARADVIAAPNDYIASRYRTYDSRLRVEVVGTPKMDGLLKVPHESDGRTVAVSFHWTGMRSGRTVPREFRDELQRLNEHTTVLGHAHPRFFDLAAKFYTGLGIEAVADFNEVVRRADVYACDHSSTIYEWTALDRPVVLMSRRGVVPGSSGLRYIDHADVGPTATPDTLTEVALMSLGGDAEHAEQRRAATLELFPYLGHATARAVAIVEGLA